MSDYRLKIPDGKWGTIMADPPWMLSSGGAKRKLHYDTMTPQEILDVGERIREVTTPDAHLWLWVPPPHVPLAVQVVEAWGFEWKTVLVWNKKKMGLGWWLRSKVEFCILAAKSTKKRVTPRSYTTYLEAPYRGHSVKPDEIIPMIEALSPAPRLELFARKPRKNWTALISNAQPKGDPYGKG